jgi:hypothetical protein
MSPYSRPGIQYNIDQIVMQYFKIPEDKFYKDKNTKGDTLFAKHVAWYLHKKLHNTTAKPLSLQFMTGKENIYYGIRRIRNIVSIDKHIAWQITFIESLIN